MTLALAFALLPAALLDRGPDGVVRLSPFPAALVVLDPYLWTCAFHSVALAASVTLAALVVGVASGRIIGGGRFRGRSTLASAVILASATPPTFAALGLRALFGPISYWQREGGWSSLVPWGLWFWASLTGAAPLVAVAVANAVGRVDPVWEDSARLAGASERRIWGRLVWPVVRSDVAKALGLVFTLSLVEPGGPLVLGLRRTLGFQLAEAALDRGPLTRAATLAVCCVVMACAGRLLLSWWGGPRSVEDRGDVRNRLGVLPWRRSAGAVTVLGLAAALLWLPVVGLISAGLSVTTLEAMIHDPLIRGTLVDSALVGLAVVLLDLLLIRTLATSRAPRLVEWPEAIPPLALGVGALALPSVSRMLVDWLGARSTMGHALGPLVALIDPDRSPWVALILTLAVCNLPLLARSAVDRQRAFRPVLLEAALTLGASPARARRLSGRSAGPSLAALVLTFRLAATNVAPALVLCPTADVRTLGPAVIILADEPGGGFNRAAGMALLGIGLTTAAIAIGKRSLPLRSTR